MVDMLSPFKVVIHIPFEGDDDAEDIILNGEESHSENSQTVSEPEVSTSIAVSCSTPDSIKQQKITDLLFSPSMTVKKQEMITESIVRYIAKDMLPLSSKNAWTLLDRKNRVASDLNGIDFIALTTDCWTSRSTESYISITAHGITNEWKIVNYILTTELMDERHTSINLKDKLLDIIRVWDIYNKVVCIVHDNAINIKNAVCSMAPDIKSRTCFAHSLQRCVNKGLEDKSIKDLLSTASSIVSHFKHSTVASKAFLAAQKNLKMSTNKLVQSVKIRWNSVYAMLVRLNDSRQAICSVLNDRTVTTRTTALTLELSESKWELLEYLIKVLEPFNLVTNILSSAKTPTISTVQPILKNPRYKNQFADNNNDGMMDLIRNFIQTQLNFDDGAGIIKTDRDTAQHLEMTALDILFPDNERCSEQNELDKYVKEKTINKNACPLVWWKENSSRYPNISKLAKKKVCIPSTSTPSERAFSNAGNIITAKRNCLSGETAKLLIFLSHNTKQQN
ncbi:PREDICTED: zinc finger BED domain-containing protein 4-like [Diuraphis noxia]|uniref:zinc finger BED domain-containing protein 4-like n=1 Tax=Diuraphis noxia TaxID=143948 RepID=UPI0007639574|nr:PREDICTED: zinc finger BED domain-containing protein 4-like [Diuraphis noxia]